MADKEGMQALRQSGLNAAWFKRYEHVCEKYANPARVSNAAKASISPLIEKNLAVKRQQRVQRAQTRASTKLPPIGARTHPPADDGRSSAPPGTQRMDEDTKKKKRKPPKVQVRRGPDYVQPARLRTFEARLSCKVTAAADPYSPEVRRISQNNKMSAKRIEQLHMLFLDASKGRRTLDLPSFRKLMASLGQEDRPINDRMFEIYDDDRNKLMGFETFCTAILNFKTGSRADQANVLFQIIDVSDDKNLSKFELLKFFCAGMKDKEKKRAMSDVVNELMKLIDEDGSGEVDHGEFVEKVSNDDDVWLIFDAISPFSEVKERLSNFKFGSVDHSISFDD